WEYGTTFHVLLVDALQSALGSSFDLDQFPGFLQSPQYIRQMLFPTGRVFNYSDNNDGRQFHAVLFWFARRTNDPTLAHWERNALLRNDNSPTRTRFLPLALIWWNPADHSEPEKASSAPLNYVGRGRNS